MNKTTLVNEYELPIEVNKVGSYYIAKCTMWTDCYAQGYSLDSAVDAVSEVAKGLIEIYEQEDKKIPLGIDKREFDKL